MGSYNRPLIKDSTGLGLDRDSKTLTQEQVEDIRRNFLDRLNILFEGQNIRFGPSVRNSTLIL